MENSKSRGKGPTLCGPSVRLLGMSEVSADGLLRADWLCSCVNKQERLSTAQAEVSVSCTARPFHLGKGHLRGGQCASASPGGSRLGAGAVSSSTPGLWVPEHPSVVGATPQNGNPDRTPLHRCHPHAAAWRAQSLTCEQRALSGLRDSGGSRTRVWEVFRVTDPIISRFSRCEVRADTHTEQRCLAPCQQACQHFPHGMF